VEASGLGIPEKYGSVSVGVWGNFDVSDYDDAVKRNEFSEIDWYAVYGLPSFVDGLDLSIGFTEYTYPGSSADADGEVNLAVGYALFGVDLGVSANLGVGGGISGSTYYTLSAGYTFLLTEELELALGALAGYLDPDAGKSGFNEGVLDCALSYALNEVWSVGVSASYIAQLDDEVLVDKTPVSSGYDVKFVGMFSLSAAF
jgi:hypothetical protein